MRLYHMTTLKNAVDYILPERRMRFSRFDNLNDPFELKSIKFEGRDGRYIFKKVLEHYIKNVGLLCMVEHWKSPLMWAHYTQNHQGVCLGFDVTDEDMPTQITYTEERTTHILVPNDPHGGVTFDMMKGLSTTKAKGWSYEEEWRLLGELKEPDPINGSFYLPFSETFVLREIIVGSRCDATVESFRKYVGKVDKFVTIIQSRPAFKTFTIVQKNDVPAVVVMPEGDK